MSSGLVVSVSEKSAEFLRETLLECGINNITVAQSGSDARRKVSETAYDIVLINTPLSDEYGIELSAWVGDSTTSGVVALVKADMSEELSHKVEQHGVFVAAKPINKGLLSGAVKLVLASHRKILDMMDQNEKLRLKLEEIRLVDRAKCALIEYSDMTEAMAHKYIEKQAMNERTTRSKIAMSILKTYEL